MFDDFQGHEFVDWLVRPAEAIVVQHSELGFVDLREDVFVEVRRPVILELRFGTGGKVFQRRKQLLLFVFIVLSKHWYNEWRFRLPLSN